MATSETRYIRGRKIRATKLDGCGAPVLGPDSVVVTKGFISVGLTPNTTAGTAITVENANGETMIDDTPTPRFRNWGVEVAFIGVNPELLHLMTGQPVVLNAAGDEIVGFRIDSEIDVELLGFALEMWTGVAVEVCEDGTVKYGYALVPFIKGGTIGGITVENGAISFTVTGAQSRNGSGWGAGPFDVVEDEDGNAGPLNEAVVSSTHLHWEKTAIAPPTEDDGSSSALGVAGTTGVAGTPGSTTPSNSYAPADFAELTADPLTASPTTAWTSGQRIVLRDGSTAHWNGTAWVAGPA